MTDNGFEGEEYKDLNNLPEVGKITESAGIDLESKANSNKPELKKGWFSKFFGVKSQSIVENLGSSNQDEDLDRKEDDDIFLGISKDGLSNEIKSPINIEEIYHEKLQDSDLRENSDSSTENITQEERKEGMIFPEMEILSHIIEGSSITNTSISSSDVNFEISEDTYNSESEGITLDFEEIIVESIVYEDMEIEPYEVSGIVLENEDYINLYEVEEFYEIDIEKLDNKKIDNFFKFLKRKSKVKREVSADNELTPPLHQEREEVSTISEESAGISNKLDTPLNEVISSDKNKESDISTGQFVLNPVDEVINLDDVKPNLLEETHVADELQVVEVDFKSSSFKDERITKDESSTIGEFKSQGNDSIQISKNKVQKKKRSKKIKISREDETLLQRFTRRENNKESFSLLGSGLSFLILQILFSLQFSIGGLRNLSFAVVATNCLLATVAISLLLLLVIPKYYLKGSKLFFEYTTIKFFNLLSLIFLTIVYFLALPFAKIFNRKKYLLAHPEHLYWVENLNGFTGWSTWRNKIIVENKKTFLLTLIGVFAYRKNYFLFAIFIILLIISMFILFAQSSAIAPFIYTIL